jgi:RNA polymerase sigma factor (sigma-70 family)
MTPSGPPDDATTTASLYDHPTDDEVDVQSGLAGYDAGAIGEGFHRGDRPALAEAYRRWSPLVYTVALRTLGSHDEAQDVTRTVFSETWRSRTRFDPGRQLLPAWLVGNTRHAVSDRFAERVRESQAQQQVGAPDPPAPSQHGIADRVTDAVVVADGLSRLDQPRRRVVEMSFFDGLTHSQIAESLDIPLGAVKRHITSGLVQLKTHLEVSDGAS